MPHRRNVGSKRKFKDGEYRLLSSVRSKSELESHMLRLRSVPGPKLRYILGEDCLYHIYAKITQPGGEGDNA